MVRQLVEFEIENYTLKNIQVSTHQNKQSKAKILATLIVLKYPNCWVNYLEPVVELLQRYILVILT